MPVILSGGMKIFPRKIDFFEIFDRAVTNLARASSLLVDLLNNFENVEEKVKEIHEIEQEGDTPWPPG
jgi:uncharacterized protein Yka (UPF0111/DUF47 family)